MMRRLSVLPAVVAMAALSACNYYNKTKVDVQVVNKSHEAIRNIEVEYPGGSYGVPMLDVYADNTKPVDAAKQACKMKLKFQDTTGKNYAGDADFGQSCPAAVTFTVDEQMQVSTRH